MPKDLDEVEEKKRQARLVRFGLRPTNHSQQQTHQTQDTRSFSSLQSELEVGVDKDMGQSR